MAVDVKAELERQLSTVEDKIAALTAQLDELQPEKERLVNTLGFLTGRLTVAQATTRKTRKAAAGDGTSKSPLFKRRFILSRFYKASVTDKPAIQKELDANKAAALASGKTEAEITEHDKKYNPKGKK